MYILTEISRNVHKIKCAYKKGWEQWVLLSSDQHWDHPDCNEKLLLKHFNLAVQRNAPIIIVGDFLCGMQTKFDKRGSKGKVKIVHAVDNYIDALVESAGKFLAPFAQNIAIYGRGNHEQTFIKRHETDLVQRVVNEVNRLRPDAKIYSGGYGGYIRFAFSRDNSKYSNCFSVNLKYRHSGGSLGEVTKGVLGVDRMSKVFPDADIIVTGDNHESWKMSVMQERLSERGVLSHKEQVHIKLATYKEEYKDGYSGFHVERDAPPKPLGGTWLRFYLESDTVKFEVIDAR